MLGMLGNPIVTLTWACEQADFHILGSSPRASDIRIYLSFITNVIFVIAIELIYEYDKARNSYLIAIVFAYLSSHNSWINLGIKKAFRIENQKSIV